MSSVRLGGLILALLGGAFVLVVPVQRIDAAVSPTVASLSIWRAHEACGGFDQAASAAAHCSTITTLWAVGVGVFGLGFLLMVGGLLRVKTGPGAPLRLTRARVPTPTPPVSSTGPGAGTPAKGRTSRPPRSRPRARPRDRSG